MIQSLFLEFGGWSWIVLGLLLLTVEIVAASTFFLWFGISALVVGLVTFVLGGTDFWSWQAQWIVFVTLSILLVIIGRKYLANRITEESDNPNLNRRATQLIGREAVLIEAISQGIGRIKLGDTIWRVKGSDAPLGSTIKVVGEEGGTLLLVELRKTD